MANSCHRLLAGRGPGDKNVPAWRARRALQIWLGDPRVGSRQAAEQVLRQLDNSKPTVQARRALIETLTDIANTGRADLYSVTHAVREVFEPGAGAVRRAAGQHTVPFMSDSLITLIRAHLEAIDRLADGTVTDDGLTQVRRVHLVAYAE